MDLNEVLPPNTLGVRNTNMRGIVDEAKSPPEGIGTGLLGPAAWRRDLLDAERLMRDREAQRQRDSAAAHVGWTRSNMREAEVRAEAAEQRIARDLNPLGRGQRHAEWQLQAAQARRDLAAWAEDAADAVRAARALGVSVAELGNR